MSTNEIAAKVQELRELRRMAEELAAEIDGLQDAIKQHMDAAGVDTWRAWITRSLTSPLHRPGWTPRPSRQISRSCTPSIPSRPRRAGFVSLEGVPGCYLSCC